MSRASGAPVGAAGSSGTPWIVAGSAIVLLLALIVYEVVAKRPTAVVPDMANSGASASGPATAGQAPDISRMTPRERFDRLFDRIMTAEERGDTAAASQFAPMALGAYSMLDTIDADARYHAAMIHLGLGEVPEAEALADTILRINPGHLFGYMIRGAAARQQNNAARLAESQRDFLAHYDAELKADRLEYREHRPVIDEFRAEAGKRN